LRQRQLAANKGIYFGARRPAVEIK